MNSLLSIVKPYRIDLEEEYLEPVSGLTSIGDTLVTLVTTAIDFTPGFCFDGKF